MEEELRDAEIARLLLQGANCYTCRFFCPACNSKPASCKFLPPVEIKYPNDYQLFIDGLLQFDGLDANNNKVIVIGDKLYINQNMNISLIENQRFQIYSRGIDDSGKLDCQKINIVYKTRDLPAESFCMYYEKL